MDTEKTYIHSDSLYLIDENEERRKRKLKYNREYYKKNREELCRKRREKYKRLKSKEK